MGRFEEWNFFRGTYDLCLFVEDEATRVFMNTLLETVRPVAIHIAGAAVGVRVLVKRFESYGAVGWIDRDFRNRNPEVPVLCSGRVIQSQRHEIENYLLDSRVLHEVGLSHGSVEEVESALRDAAKQQLAWLACRKVVFNLHEQMQCGFPTHPKLSSIPDIDHARDWLCHHPWVTDVSELSHNIGDHEALRKTLDVAYEALQVSLRGDDWRSDFSGKEIFRTIFQKFHRGNSTEIDIIKCAVDFMLEHDKLPEELVSFRFAIGSFED